MCIFLHQVQLHEDVSTAVAGVDTPPAATTASRTPRHGRKMCRITTYDQAYMEFGGRIGYRNTLVNLSFWWSSSTGCQVRPAVAAGTAKPVKHVTRYEKSREEREYDVVLGRFRDEDKEQGYQQREGLDVKRSLEKGRV